MAQRSAFPQSPAPISSLIPRRLSGAPTGAVVGDGAIRWRVGTALRAGSLPLAIRRMSGTLGTGKACSICGDPIESSELEYEVPDLTVRLHLRCFTIWQEEAFRLAPAPGRG